MAGSKETGCNGGWFPSSVINATKHALKLLGFGSTLIILRSAFGKRLSSVIFHPTFHVDDSCVI